MSDYLFQFSKVLTALIDDLSWTMNHKGETDWNIVTPPQEGLKGRQCHVPRGRFLGGSSGCNGTICVRGVEQDYDDWGAPEWTGKEMFRAMKKVYLHHSIMTNSGKQ